MHKMTAELATTLENFQQACVGFTGPYNDAHDRLCKLYNKTAGDEVSSEDIEFVRELVRDLTSTLESLEGDMDVEQVIVDLDEVEEQCEHGNEADMCEICYPEDEA